MTTTQVPTELFISFFEAGIRVLFNWNRLRHENWPIRVEVINQPDELSQWYVPWYIGKDNREVDYSEIDAKPLRLCEIGQYSSGLNPDRQDLIASLTKFYKTSKQPVQLVVPTYALNGEERLILDGNHRLASVVGSGIPFTIMIFTIYGPLDTRVLPDLQHWL